MKQNMGTLAVFAVAAIVFAVQFSEPPWTVSRIVGMAIVVPSSMLFVLARIQLGRAFSLQAKATTLVTTGLYSRIRNPIYVFGGLMIAGFILWAGKPWLLLCFVILVPLQVYRSRREEQVLAEKFGTAYEEYKRHTWL